MRREPNMNVLFTPSFNRRFRYVAACRANVFTASANIRKTNGDYFDCSARDARDAGHRGRRTNSHANNVLYAITSCRRRRPRDGCCADQPDIPRLDLFRCQCARPASAVRVWCRRAHWCSGQISPCATRRSARSRCACASACRPGSRGGACGAMTARNRAASWPGISPWAKL